MSVSSGYKKTVWELTVQDAGKKKSDMSWAINRYMEQGDPEIVRWG
jgi:hypothetical protein